MGVAAVAIKTVAVVGLGYVGLPTGIALADAGLNVFGIDTSERRLADIREGGADLLADRSRASGGGARRAPGAPARMMLTSDADALADADAVVICVPTPVDERPAAGPALPARRRADGRRAGTAGPAHRAHEHQLRRHDAGPARPCRWRAGGFEPGEDVHVAFSPERIDPGNTTLASGGRAEGRRGRHAGRARAAAEGVVEQIAATRAPGLLAGGGRAHEALRELVPRGQHRVRERDGRTSSRRFGLDPIEVIEAAATKPYGFMAFYPGPGVGGHCIPCDPHYLLGGLREAQATAPVLERAMEGIAARPREVVARAAELLESRGIAVACARVLVVGVAYKPGIQDTRESPALEILRRAVRSWARRSPTTTRSCRRLRSEATLALLSVAEPQPEDFDLAIVVTVHPGFDYAWLERFDRCSTAPTGRPRGRRGH